MTQKQKDFIFNLVLANLILYLVIAYFWFQPALPTLPNFLQRPTALALKPTNTPIPSTTPTVTPTSKPSPTPTRTARPVVRQATAVTAPTVVAAPSGSSPSNLMTPLDSWRTINPGSQLWYKIGSGGLHISVFLEAKPTLDGISMDVFAPGLLEQPIGRGTLERALNRLVWAGGHWQSDGDWVARVSNANSTTVEYKLTTSAKDTSNKSCYSYWEYINGSPYYWTECQGQ